MHVLYFNNGSGLGAAKSGGTTRLIETARRLGERGVAVSIVTTHGALTLFREEKLLARFFLVRASLISMRERNNLDRAWGYILSTLHSLLLILRLPKCDVVYAPSDYFCDVLPAVAYKFARPSTRFVAMIHHRCRPPKQRRGNLLINLASYLVQRFSFWFVARYADQVFVYDTPEGEVIGDYFRGRGVRAVTPVANGITLAAIDQVPAGSVTYDACFVGGLRASKGIYDLIPIWQGVQKRFQTARLVIIGGGTPSVTADFRARIAAAGLSDHIILLGALPSGEFYRVMKMSRVCISTSHEEGWGIAICEALACGLPVVAYSLPAFAFLRGYLDEVPQQDHVGFVGKVLRILSDSEYAIERGLAGRIFIRQYDWDAIAVEELRLLRAENYCV